MSAPLSGSPRAPQKKRVAKRVPFGLAAHEHGLFFGLLKRDGIPLPETEYTFAPPRRWRFDFAWPSEWDSHGEYMANMNGPSVALEVEGGIWQRGGGRHNRGKGMLADMEKYNEAAIRGWKVLRVTPQQLCTLETVALIKRALAL